MKATHKIVGIGASAGGLKAISEFFDHIPTDSGFTFVVIQHLSPNFKSMMSELLGRHTSLPIHVVDKPTQPEPNSIYLISSKFNVVLKNALLVPTKRSDPKSINLPIDQFFSSIAKEHKNNTAAIILSGTGSDGAIGVKEIKKAGGLVMVEDPHYAQFDGMPLAAIASKAVDYILQPYALARELTNTNKQKRNDNGFLIIDSDDRAFEPLFADIIAEVNHKTGINFSDYRNSTLIRRIEKRMFITKNESLEDYNKFLKKDDNEASILQQEFLINVTHFFRDTQAFDELKKQVIPNLMNNKLPHEQVRVWVPACSTGQEAISIAILFKEYMESQDLINPLKIFASDVDKVAIEKASEGVYDVSLLNNISPELFEKYFEPVNIENTKFKPKKKLRIDIVYAVHDSIYDPPFINLDLVSCRNMMIYLNQKNQQILLSNFQFSLKYQGYLFLGPSETLGDFKRFFKNVSSKWNIYQKTSNENKMYTHFLGKKRNNKIDEPRAGIAPRKDIPVVKEKNVVFNDKKFIKLLIQQYAPTCIVLNDNLEILLTNGDVGELLTFPHISSDFNLREMVGFEEMIVFQNGIEKAKETGNIVEYENIEFKRRDKLHSVGMRFKMIKIPNHIFDEIFIVEFDVHKGESKPITKKLIPKEKFYQEKFGTIEKELSRIQYEKQVLVQKLETVNEELQASNEELLASNEELQSTNEELQSVNEELYTVNTELQNKVNQLITTTNDLDNLLNSTEIGSIFLNKDLQIRRFTPAVVKQFELLDSDIGRSITTFSNSFAEESMYDEIKKVVTDLIILEKEIKDEKGNNYLMRVLPYRTEEGFVDGAVLTFIPINELKKAHDSLEEAGEKYRAVFEHSYDSIVLIDKVGKINSSNFSFAGYSKEEILGKDIVTVLPADYREVLNMAMQSVFDGAPSSTFNFDRNENDGKQYFSATITPVIVKDEIMYLALITRDITELKTKELELRKMSISLEKQVANRSMELEQRNLELSEMNTYLDSFVHGAAHDLRAPITQINGYMDLLDKLDNTEKKEGVFKEVGKSIKRLDKTLTGLIQMIDFQKNGKNKIPEEVNLYKYYLSVVDQMSKDIEEADAIIEEDFDKELTISFIPAYLTSIFYNLLSNAIKYRVLDSKLRINVTVKQEDKYVVISVADNGIGIDLNRYGHFLFKPFKRLTVEREGTGIGLSIINNLVEKRGGKIDVSSKLGKGTTFSVSLKANNNHGQRAR